MCLSCLYHLRTRMPIVFRVKDVPLLSFFWQSMFPYVNSDFFFFYCDNLVEMVFADFVICFLYVCYYSHAPHCFVLFLKKGF